MAGFLDALRAFFNPAPGFEPEAFEPIDEVYRIRGLTYEQMWNTGADEVNRAIDAEQAMRIIAVQAAIRLLANDIGSLPVDAFRSQDRSKKELAPPPWVLDPNPLNPNDTWDDHIAQVVVSILGAGNAFVRCWPNRYRTEGVEALDPNRVAVRTARGSTEYDVTGVGILTPAEVIHIPWLRMPGKAVGLNPIEYAKTGLSVGLNADRFVDAYFTNGAILSGVIEFPAGADPTTEQVAGIKADFQRKHVGARKSHAVGALTGGATFKPLDYNNRDAQLQELRDSIVEDVARLFGIPPHMLGSQKPGAVGYASVEQRSIDYVTHAVLPIVRRIEKAYSRLLRGQQTYLKFNLNGLLRADANARAAFYGQMAQIKAIRRDEIRALEDLPFDPDAVGYLETPNNNPPDGPADDPAQEPQP